ncbi:hypothetical protein FRC01_000962 [Tulasnella sp. 417]|nr:hypothetical protein FRC01_000962 [Tulasnella sp. 417]
MEIVRLSMPSGYHFPRPAQLLFDTTIDPNPNAVTPLLRNFLYVISSAITQLEAYGDEFVGPSVNNTPMQDLFRQIGEVEAPGLESVRVENPFYGSNSPALPNLIKSHASTISRLSLEVPHNEQLWIATRSLRNLKELSIDFEVAWDSEPLSSPKDTVVALGDMTSGTFPKLETFSAFLPPTDFCLEHRRSEIFKGFARSTQLVSLTLTSSTPIMPYAKEMWHIGQSLHRLETLRIDIRPLADQEKLGTASSLVSILQVFPHIRHLDTGVICDSIPDTAKTEPHTALEVLDLSWSPAPKARQEDIAAFMRSILPRTARVVHLGERRLFGMSEGEAAWDEVARLIDEAA